MTIKKAKEAYLCLATRPQVSELLGKEYDGLLWRDTHSLQEAREKALIEGIAEATEEGFSKWLAPLREAADRALSELAFVSTWR